MYYGWGGGENAKSSYELLTVEDQPFDNTVKPSCPNSQSDNDNFACVCTVSQPCPKIEPAGKTPPNVVSKYSTTFYGKRMVKESSELHDKDEHVDIGTGDVSQVYVKVNRDNKFQTIQGFGGAFTDATGYNLKTVDKALQVPQI